MRFFVYSCAIMEALKTEAQMSNWNDDRLDKRDQEMKEGFTRVEGHITRVEGHIARVEGQVVRVEGQVVRLEDKMDKRFDRLNYILLTGAIAIIGVLIGFHG
jgi:predicted nuclease with TOPRIM domain